MDSQQIISSKILIDNAEKLIRILAIIIGGIWVYAKAIKGRVFIPRLQARVSGRILNKGKTQYILARMEVENVGSSIVEIREKGTGLKLSYLRGIGKFAKVPEATDLFVIKETALGVFNFSRIRRIFSLFDFKTIKIKTLKIEPGTALNAEQLIEIPRNRYDAFRLLLRVSALGVSFPVTRNLQIRIKKFFKDIEEDKAKNDTKNTGKNFSEGGDKDGVERFIGDRSWDTVAIVTYEDKEQKEIS